jgi:YceI-like domain
MCDLPLVIVCPQSELRELEHFDDNCPLDWISKLVVVVADHLPIEVVDTPCTLASRVLRPVMNVTLLQLTMKECRMLLNSYRLLQPSFLPLVLTFAFLISSLSWSQTPSVTADDSGRQGNTTVLEAGQVHLGTSRVFIHVYKTGLGHEHGVIGRLRQGNVMLNGSQSGGELVFDMRSFDADSELARRYVGLSGTTNESTRQQVNANMHGASVLDTKTHPTATLKIRLVTKLAQESRRQLPQYQLDGDFTLRGVTQPIRIMADVEPKNGWLHLRGGFSILQSKYRIKPFTKAFGAVGVADRLDIFGDLWIASEQITSERATVNQPARR